MLKMGVKRYSLTPLEKVGVNWPSEALTPCFRGLWRDWELPDTRYFETFLLIYCVGLHTNATLRHVVTWIRKRLT